MKRARMSQVQKEVLRCLAKAFIKGVKEGKSTVINLAVNQVLGRDIHPNNVSVFKSTHSILLINVVTFNFYR